LNRPHKGVPTGQRMRRAPFKREREK
jgi:hypothetical protein